MTLDLKWQSTTNFLECYEVEYAMAQGMPSGSNVGTLYEPKAELIAEDISDDFKDYLATKSNQRTGFIPYSTLSDNSIIVVNQGQEYLKNEGSIYSIYNMKEFSRPDLRKTYLTILNDIEGPTFFTENKDCPPLYTKERMNRAGYSFLRNSDISSPPKLYYGGYHLPTTSGESKVEEYLVPELPERTDKKLLKEVIEYLNRGKKQMLDEIDDLKVDDVMKAHLKAWTYDFMFQQFDMILILIVRGIQLPKPLERVRLHYLFIQNMYTPGSFGSYIRRPLSLFTNTIDGMENMWLCVTNMKYSFSHQHYRKLANDTKLLPLIVTTNMLRSAEISQSERLRLFNNLKSISGSVFRAKHDLSLTLPNLKVNEYEPTFRDKKLKTAKLKHWNLSRWYIPNDDPHAYAGAEIKEINDQRYIYWAYDMFADVKSDPDGDIIYQDLESESSLDTSITSGRVKINGVEFNLRDVQLLYNTHLFDLIKFSGANFWVNSQEEAKSYTGEKEFIIPNITRKDLTLLRDLFKGRISLLYFYENISRYMYDQISEVRTMIDIFEFLPARYFILKVYELGLPLRDQLKQVKYEQLGTIGRLDELIQIASEV